MAWQGSQYKHILYCAFAMWCIINCNVCLIGSGSERILMKSDICSVLLILFVICLLENRNFFKETFS